MGKPAGQGADRSKCTLQAALDRWQTAHTPAVLALDQQLGALLIEAIEPGTPLVSSSTYPELETVAELLNSLHASGVPAPAYPRVGQRVAYLFDSSLKLYERLPELTALIPPELYERGRRLANRLAEHDSPIVLLHGDLTPAISSTVEPSAGSSRSTPRPASAMPPSTRLT